MLEKACHAVEQAGRSGGVYPEVLFEVAKQWEWIHQKVRFLSCVRKLPLRAVESIIFFHKLEINNVCKKCFFDTFLATYKRENEIVFLNKKIFVNLLIQICIITRPYLKSRFCAGE